MPARRDADNLQICYPPSECQMRSDCAPVDCSACQILRRICHAQVAETHQFVSQIQHRRGPDSLISCRRQAANSRSSVNLDQRREAGTKNRRCRHDIPAGWHIACSNYQVHEFLRGMTFVIPRTNFPIIRSSTRLKGKSFSIRV